MREEHAPAWCKKDKMKVYIYIFALFISTGGCKKYPEDDKFHLSTVKNRLSGGVLKGSKIWEPKQSYNFISTTDIFFSTDEMISFGKKGVVGGYMCNTYFNYSGIFTPSNSCNFHGTWEFLEKKAN